MAEQDGNFVERRHCSDELCDKARSKWLEEVVWPKVRIQMAVMIAATVLGVAGVFFFMSDAAITKYDLSSRDRYVTLVQHQTDMARIEAKIGSLEKSVIEYLGDLKRSMDRNLLAINSMK